MQESLPPVLFVGSSTKQWEDFQGAATGLARAERATTAADALVRLGAEPFDTVIVSAQLPDRPGMALLTRIVSGWPDLPVVLALQKTGVDQSAAALDAGASELIRDPSDVDEIRLVLEKCLRQAERVAHAPPTTRQLAPANVVGESTPMQSVLELARKAAAGSATVLVRGESGVGKEVIARQIHRLSARSTGPFVKVHCAALPEQMIESELFGYEKGAFTGAQQRKPGRVELADGGTLFLDEIGDISAATQVKLLRILQDKEYERLGGTKTLQANVRFITATHRNLERMVKKGDFREDLYYRLNVVPITVPPLRDRMVDVERLAHQFVSAFAAENGKSVTMSDRALERLMKERWPGNVRQLQNFIERIVVLCDANVIDLPDVARELEGDSGSMPMNETPSEVSVIELSAAVRQAERRAIEKALRKSNGDRTVAARILGVSRRTLFYKLREHHIS